MKIKPILYSTPMVRSILDGRKTQTRRIIKHFGNSYHYGQLLCDWGLSDVPVINNDTLEWTLQTEVDDNTMFTMKIPYQARDIMWVRETFYAYGHWSLVDGKWKFSDMTSDFSDYFYEDNPPKEICKGRNDGLGWYKRPSIFMPKEACRIFLEVTDVRVDRLNDISEEDAISEGVKKLGEGWKGYDIINHGKHKGSDHPHNMIPYKDAKVSFESLWDSINGKGSWNDNPYVFVYKFKQVDKPENFYK